jgi:site-specific DNA-methyltransferase (adenine-specific)
MSYQIILADPPWLYRDKATAGNRGAVHDCGEMTVEELCAMPVRALAADRAVLFLWVTWPLLLDCAAAVKARKAGKTESHPYDLLPVPLRVMLRWGFTPKTDGFMWTKHSREGAPLLGGGSYTRANSEPCLFGVRGRGLTRLDAGVSQVVQTFGRLPKNRKPDIREDITKLFGDLPRVELFAREAVTGWDRWGLEAPRGKGHLPLEKLAPYQGAA